MTSADKSSSDQHGSKTPVIDGKLMLRAAERIAAAKQIVVLTGAGVSKESGIPTFRDALTGLWAQYDPEKLATPEGFLADPPLVWQWYDYRRKMVANIEPNPGHYALARLGELKPLTLITQNIDGLHQKAGSKNVIELHGNIKKFICFDKRHEIRDVPFDLPEPLSCPQCQSMVRPAVVWFGEALPPEAMSKSSRLAYQMSGDDVFLVIGTSGLVQPAASLPYWAHQSGATVIEINPDVTPIGDLADIFLQGPSGVVLPELVDLVEKTKR